MHEYDNDATVRSSSTSDFEKLKNAQLKQGLVTLINESRNDEPSNSVLLQEYRIVNEDDSTEVRDAGFI